MRKMIILLLILLSICLTSCKNNTEKAQDMITVFALNPEETGLVSRVSDVPVNDPNCIEKLMKALCESDGEVYVSAAVCPHASKGCRRENIFRCQRCKGNPVRHRLSQLFDGKAYVRFPYRICCAGCRSGKDNGLLFE